MFELLELDRFKGLPDDEQDTALAPATVEEIEKSKKKGEEIISGTMQKTLQCGSPNCIKQESNTPFQPTKQTIMVFE